MRAGLARCSIAATAACLAAACTPSAPVSGGFDAGPDGGDAGPDGGDGGSDAGFQIQLAMALHRLPSGDAGPDAIIAVIVATSDAGSTIPGLQITVDAGGVVAVAAEDAGFYVATVIPPFPSGELTLLAEAGGARAQRTALVLPAVAAEWDQPEPVAGLVNTPGTEDSSTVSPDGEWLIVASYSPMDLLCCSSGCGGYPGLDGDNPECVDALGPISGPARPGMPGAERVVGGVLRQWSDPQMCSVWQDGGPIPIPDDGGTFPLALPLVAAYGFHRQADGSYAEPFLIDLDADGFLGAPFCMTLLGSGDAGDSVPAIFGYAVYAIDGGKPHPWVTSLTMGSTNVLGSYVCESAALPGYPTFAPGAIESLPIGPVDQQAGNTSLASLGGASYLFSDDESAHPPYVEYSRILDGGYADWAPMALPEPSADRRQPVLAGTRLFYYRNADIVSVAWSGQDPGSSDSFGDLTTELQSEVGGSSGRLGKIIAVGQPTFAVIDGGVRMFFVYYRLTSTGADGQIGSVPLR